VSSTKRHADAVCSDGRRQAQATPDRGYAVVLRGRERSSSKFSRADEATRFDSRSGFEISAVENQRPGDGGPDRDRAGKASPKGEADLPEVGLV